MSAERTMVYKVMSASPDLRRRAGRRLGLLLEHEDKVGVALDKALLERAIAQGRLAELRIRAKITP